MARRSSIWHSACFDEVMAWPLRIGPVSFRWVMALVPLSAVALMVPDIDTPIHGSFYFRQAHVAANVELLLEDGFSLAPGTYNVDVPYQIFDFPAYQLFVAFFSRFSGSDPLRTARVLNIVVFLLNVLLIDRILLSTGMGRLHRFLCRFFYCFSPMNLFYYRCPFVDPLAIGLSLLALYAFLRLERSRGRERLGWLAILIAASVPSSLIKNPVYFPVFIAVALHTVWRRFEPMRRSELSAYAAAVGGAVLGFKMWSNRVNGIDSFFAGEELREYFGPLADRFDPESWHRIAGVLDHDAANSLTLGLAVLGAAFWALRSRRAAKPLYLGLIAGWTLTLLVFFNRFTWHNYYLLGAEFPLALFGAHALGRAQVLSRLHRRRSRSRRRVALAGALAAVAFYTVLSSIAMTKSLAATPTEWIRERGDFVRASTEPGDFVLYVIESDDFRDWNPVFLYFAKRTGHNVTTRRIERHPGYLVRLKRRYGREDGRLLVFCPPEASLRLGPILESAGARLLEASPLGRLYQLSGRSFSSASA
jgi:hypothetical protein